MWRADVDIWPRHEFRVNCHGLKADDTMLYKRQRSLRDYWQSSRIGGSRGRTAADRRRRGASLRLVGRSARKKDTKRIKIAIQAR